MCDTVSMKGTLRRLDIFLRATLPGMTTDTKARPWLRLCTGALAGGGMALSATGARRRVSRRPHPRPLRCTTTTGARATMGQRLGSQPELEYLPRLGRQLGGPAGYGPGGPGYGAPPWAPPPPPPPPWAPWAQVTWNNGWGTERADLGTDLNRHIPKSEQAGDAAVDAAASPAFVCGFSPARRLLASSRRGVSRTLATPWRRNPSRE